MRGAAVPSIPGVFAANEVVGLPVFHPCDDQGHQGTHYCPKAGVAMDSGQRSAARLSCFAQRGSWRYGPPRHGLLLHCSRRGFVRRYQRVG